MLKPSEQSKLASIIIPIHNSTPYLKRLLTGLLQQTYPHIEILLIDNGSNDNSYAQCQQWAQKDARIRAFHNEKLGTALARVRGIQEARGEYILFHDHDDRYINDRAIANMIRCIEESQTDICQFNFYKSRFSGLLTRKRGGVTKNELISRDTDYAEKVCGIFGYAPKNEFSTNLWDKIFKAQIMKSAISEADIPENMRYADDLLFCLMAFSSPSVHSVSKHTRAYYCWSAECGFSGNWKNGRFLVYDYNVIREKLSTFLSHETITRTTQDRVHSELLYIIRYYIHEMLEHGCERDSIKQQIEDFDSLPCIQQDKTYWRNERADGLWDEMRFMTSDYTPDEYLAWIEMQNIKRPDWKVFILEILKRFFALFGLH